VGHEIIVRFALHNVSKRPVKVPLWVFSTGAVLKAADGTTYDTNGSLASLPGIPPPVPRKLRPGATIHESAGAAVRWSGPLLITPGCLGKTLSPLRVSVAAPWPRPDPSAAVDEVVAAAGHLLDHCRPQTAGVAVPGQIDPPSGNAPPMSAQCSVSLSSEGQFLVAQVLVLTPPGLAGVQIFQPYETLWPNGHLSPLTASPPYEAIAWEFVVTRDKAIPVAASTLAASNSSQQTVPFFSWDGTSWKQDGTGTCGGTAFTWGGTGPDIEFISACPA
jgi:hypothetical protein